MADLIKVRPRLGWRIQIHGADLREAMTDPDCLGWFTEEEIVAIKEALDLELNRRQSNAN